MRRRRVLASGLGIAGATVSVGCLGSLGFETRSAWRDPPLPDDRPEAVYYPGIVEGMESYGTTESETLRFAVTFSFPHRFWNVTGTRTRKVVVDQDDSLHLMATVWDVDTETILPVDVTAEIRSDGRPITTKTLWPMLSQNMGFHYGDNVTLPDAGTYELTLGVGPLQIARTDPLEGRLTESQRTTTTFGFDPDSVSDLPVRRLRDKAGERGAVDRHEREGVPTSVAPGRGDLPGRLLGEGTSGDASVPVTLVEGDSRFGREDRPYLLVSPRTPYNRVILPRMALAARVRRGSETIFEDPLEAGIDPRVGPFYGAHVDDVRSGDAVELLVQSPPQVARHDGYETAFVDMPRVEITV